MIRTIGFTESLQLLHDLYHRPRVPAAEAGLRRAEHLLREVGDPHRTFRSVHVAGSSGKGSTTTMIGSILQAAGFRTGYFRSPHLHSYTERIAINAADIPEKEWCVAFSRIWPVVEQMEGSGSNYSLGRPTLFEVLFSLMALHFAEQGVEWAAVETGLGGRLDATNTLQSDVAVVTNVSLEHTKILGNDVESIAREKAAIIKEGSDAVTAADDPVALKVVEQRAHAVRSPLWEVGKDTNFQVLSEDLTGQKLSLSGKGRGLVVDLPIAGEFQATNAATAFATVKALRRRGVDIDDSAIVRGLSSIRMPGRFEVVHEHPPVILDGAHSPGAARALRAALRRLDVSDTVMLFAAQADKDVGMMARYLGPLIHTLVLTTVPESERSANPGTIREAFAPFVDKIAVEANVDQALEQAMRETKGRSPLIVTGSLYLVGYCRTRLVRRLVAV